jgi:serine/threonine protein kinase
VIGYKVLSGKTPYPHARAAQMISEKLQSPPTPLAQLAPGVDADLAALLERCLSRKPEHRPTAADVANRLRPVSAGAPIATVPPTPEAPRSPMEIFFDEIKRRRVYRVAVGYVIAASVIIGLLDGVSEPLNISEGAQQLIIVMTLVGLPLALAMSWMFDIRQGRIERTSDTNVEGGPRLSRILPIVALVSSLALAALGVWWVL